MTNIISSVKGTRDFYPEDMALRNWLYSQIRVVSESFGYQEFEGPLLEPIDLYAAKSGEELVKEQSFVFPDRKGELITLRPELTPTLARLVAKRQHQLVFPLRWWSFGPFWRYEQPQRGRTREFYQWNIDLIGADSPIADAELIAIGATLLMKMGLSPDQVQIYVNHRGLIDRELEAMGIPVEERPKVFRLIDRRAKMKAKAWEEYTYEIGLSQDHYLNLVSMLSDNQLWEKSAELRSLFDMVEALGVKKYIQFAPHVIRGLDYYTGTVFECFDTRRKFRSIFAGGRYDNLVSDVGGIPLAAVGFAMGDKVIFEVLKEFQLLPDPATLILTEVLVTVFDHDHLIPAYELANELRGQGFEVACYPEIDKLGKQFKYADRINARVVIVLGPDEYTRDLVTIKDLKSRSQKTLPRGDAPDFIRSILAGHSPS